MKQFFLLTALLFCCTAFAQKKRTTNVPLLSNPNLVVDEKESVDANQLYKGQAVRFAFNILNPSQSESIKAGSCSLQIAFGNKLQAKTVAANMALNNFFNWSAETDANGVTWLNGKLIADLPADFSGTAFVDLRCAETGASSIRAQWLDAEKMKQGSLSTIDVTVKKNKPKE